MEGLTDRLYRECDPDLYFGPDDPRWVNTDEGRGGHYAERIVKGISRSRPDQPDTKFLAGHIGIGKSTELKRIQKSLEALGFTVLFLDVVEKLDPNDLDFPDLLSLIAAALQEPGTRQALTLDGVSGVISELADRVWTFLNTEITIPKAEVGVKVTGIDFGKVTAEFKKNASRRGMLRNAVNSITTSLLDAINYDLARAQVGLTNAGRKGAVLIIDGLEKVRRGITGPTGRTPYERLFVDNASQLKSLKAHTVYTLPIDIVYSPAADLLNAGAGEFIQPLPMICLRGPNKSDVDDAGVGMRLMLDMLGKRCAAAGVDRDAAFAEGVPEYLCRMTGGHPRHLMAFVRAACDFVDDLPVTMEAARSAVQQYANSLFRSLPDVPNYLGKLKHFNTPQNKLELRFDVYRGMLRNLHVYEYMNAQPYYEANPVFRLLPSYEDAQPEAPTA